jgi:hypothetical protein
MIEPSNIIGNIDDVYRRGPSILGDDIISSKDALDFISNKYYVSWRDSFKDTTDDMMISSGLGMVPGKIYTFVSQKDNKATRHTIFCVMNGLAVNDVFTDYGFEIKSIDPGERARLFKAILTMFGFILQENMEFLHKNVPEQRALPLHEEGTRKFLFGSANINPRIRKYDNRLILRNTLRCIDYRHWKHLIHCDF